MTRSTEKQSGLLVCRVACPDPQKAQEKASLRILAALLGWSGRAFCGVGLHRWVHPVHGGLSNGALRVCPRCMRRQSLTFADGAGLCWRDY